MDVGGSWSAGGNGSATSVVIAQRERSVTLTSNVTSAAYTGTLSADSSEIAGTFSEGSLKQPMTFRRGLRIGSDGAQRGVANTCVQ